MNRKVENKKQQEISNSKKIFIEFLGVDYWKMIFKKIKQYAKKHPQYFGTIIAIGSAIGYWLIRTLGYTYLSAKFSFYNIDKSYIDLNDNFWLSLIEMAAISIILLGINYIYFSVATMKPDVSFSGLRRVMRKIVLYILEMCGIILWAVVEVEYSIGEFINEIRGYPIYIKIYFGLMLVLCGFSINLFGWSISRAVLKERKEKKNNNTEKNDSEVKIKLSSIIIGGIFWVSMMVSALDVYGRIQEGQRKSYKVIVEKTDTNLEDHTVFKLKEDHSFFVYVIVYENKDSYILCRLKNDSDKISIDKDCQKVIAKDNIITYKVNDVYKVNDIYKILSNGAVITGQDIM